MLHLRLALLSTVFLLPMAAAPALAAKAGVTAAVNQSAQGTPPGGGIRTIVLGADVLQDEKIDTTGKGLVQILLADGTTFTVGPNSSLTIDHFVYDPNAGTAQVTASLAKGVFRFIGGRTSKTPNGVTLNTPVGTVGIRGAVVDINLVPTAEGRRAQIDLLFGQEVTLNRQRIYQAGYSIIVGADGRLRIVKTPPGSGDLIQLILAGHSHQTGGSNHIPDDKIVASSGMPPTNSEYPVTDNLPPPLLPLPTTDFGDTITTVTADANDLTTNGEVTPPPPPPPPPPPVDTRISGTFQGFSAGLGSGYVETCGMTPFSTILTNIDPNDVTVDFSPSTDSVGGTFALTGGYLLQDISVGFGDGSSGGSSSFPSNDAFTATGTGSAATATLQYTTGPGSGGNGTTFASHGSDTLASCTCDFLQWGYWATDFDAEGEGNNGTGHVSAVGTWVTGDITSPEDFAAYSEAQANYTATYTGNAVGYAQEPDEIGTHRATGDMSMTWDFGSRNGFVDITNFDGSHEFSTSVSSSTPNGQFSTGEGSGSMNVNGAFVNNGSDKAAGVIGNFSAYEEGGYQATGIIAGQRTSLDLTSPP
ncbi:MAG TPA: FecR domain-containing protein [Devosiaceae bacterium]|nr:FecR domain-containing protein [Devosiaceae bacterium]